MPHCLPLYGNGGSVTQTQAAPVANDLPSTFFSKPAASEKASLGGKASLQPKRTPMTQEEIDAIMVSNIIFASLYIRLKVKTLSLAACLKYTFALSRA
ncbi:hypothetical protein Tco_0716621 [Tanacetum coccineum]